MAALNDRAWARRVGPNNGDNVDDDGSGGNERPLANGYNRHYSDDLVHRLNYALRPFAPTNILEQKWPQYKSVATVRRLLSTINRTTNRASSGPNKRDQRTIGKYRGTNYSRLLSSNHGHELTGSGGGRNYVKIGRNKQRRDANGNWHTGRTDHSAVDKISPAEMARLLQAQQAKITHNRTQRAKQRRVILENTPDDKLAKVRLELQSDHEQEPEDVGEEARRRANYLKRMSSLHGRPVDNAQYARNLANAWYPNNNNNNNVGHGIVHSHPLHNQMEY